jgi:hypothetical protein
MESRDSLRNWAVYHKLMGLRGPEIAIALGLNREQFRDLFKPDKAPRKPRAPKPKPIATPQRTLRPRPELTLRHKVSAFLGRAACSAPFTEADVIAMFGKSPRCYLSGEPIDYNDPKGYQLDHFVPVSRGGTSDLANLRLAKPWANMMKNGTLHAQFIERCRAIWEHSSTTVS